MKQLLKRAAMRSGVYGPLKRAHRQLIDTASRDRFRRQAEFYRQFVKPGDRCFDIGANIGEKSEVFLSFGASVVAFEPQPRCFEELKARCAGRNFTAVNTAISDHDGEMTMYIGKHHGSSSVTPGWNKEPVSQIRVPVTTLDNVIERYGKPDFAKIDVEGHELAVLSALHSPIPIITLEYHHDDVDIRKVLACVRLLASIAPLEINCTFGEDVDLCWPSWIDQDEFASHFPGNAPRSATCGYGDLLIRMKP
jgi:FkbM family methyltransferase